MYYFIMSNLLQIQVTKSHVQLGQVSICMSFMLISENVKNEKFCVALFLGAIIRYISLNIHSSQQMRKCFGVGR